jgi:hypothetical protein
VTYVGLQPVDGQDGQATLLLEPLPQGNPIREPECHQLLVAIEEVGHRALRDGDASLRKLAVDLRDAAVLCMAQSTYVRAMTSRPNSPWGSAKAPSCSGRRDRW